MRQGEEFGEQLADFVRRVTELKSARSVARDELPAVLDAAIFELDHAVEQLWPWYERLTADRADPPGPSPADRQEQELLRAIFQRLPLPVALMDRETVVRRLNFAATTFCGVRAGYATGRPLAGLLAHADRAAFRSQAAAVARGEGDRSLTVRLQQRPSAPVRATLTALRPGNEPRTAVLVVLQPSAERPPPGGAGSPHAVPDLTEATRHAAVLDIVDAMARRLLSAPPGDPEEVLRRAAQVLGQRFADWVVADSGAVRLSRVAVLGPDPQLVKGLLEQDPTGCQLVMEAARGGSTALQVRPEDPEVFGRDTAGAPVLVSADVTSLVCVPLTSESGGTVLGVITLFRSGARLAFSMAEAQALDMMARHVALALRRPGGP